MRVPLAIPLAVLTTVFGCAGGRATSGPSHVDIPFADGTHAGGTTEARRGPPPSGVRNDAPFPRVARFTLANGLSVAVVTSRLLPLVQTRLFIRGGSGDGQPAVAALTGEMVTRGGTGAMASGELPRRVETLGSNLTVVAGFDATVLAMPLTRDQLGDGLSLLGHVVREPRFDDSELVKVKASAMDDAEERARASGQRSSMQLVFRELFLGERGYATYAPLPSHISRIDGADIREFYRRFYVPKSATLVLAGDVDEAEAKVLAERHFGAWRGGEPPKPLERARPRALGPKRRLMLVHRPKSADSDIYVVTVGPARKSETWATGRVANQVLGGGGASRLEASLQGHLSAAYSASASAVELAHGEEPVLAHASTETAKTLRAVTALVEHLDRMTTSPPSTSETECARDSLVERLAIRMETMGGIADMVVALSEFGLPDGYWDAYRKRLRAIDAAQLESASKELYTLDKSLIVVAGDADAIAVELATLGDVTVVDPEKEFKTMRTIPQATK